MINAVSIGKIQNTSSMLGDVNKKSNARYKNIKYSGYASLGFMGVCALTGLKQVKFPHKMQIHKFSAILTGATAIWHLGAIKRWDKFFVKHKNS